MFNANLVHVLLFVDNPAKSAEFYSNIFGFKPVELSPTFAMFALPNGVALGLWSRHSAEPKVEAAPGAMEICFPADDVDAMYKFVSSKNVTFLQKPTDMDFGRTFVFVDVDGHRVRVYKLHEHQ